MNFDTFFNGLTEAEQTAYADKAGTSVCTIKGKYLAPEERRQIPQNSRMKRLLSATDGKVSRNEILEHFYPAHLLEVEQVA